MPTVHDLVDCVNRNDSHQFLLNYLKLIVGKCSLTLPTSREKETVIMQWQSVLPSQCKHCTQSFLESLSQLWLEIVDKQGGVVSDEFPAQCLSLLAHHHVNRPLTTNSDNSTQIKEGREPQLKEVTPSISKDYDQDKEARKERVPSVKKSKSALIQALKKGDVQVFLENYLAWSSQTPNAKVPLSSMVNKITAFWETRFERDFKYKPQREFIKSLVGKWHYLVSKKGIPQKRQELLELLYLLRTLRSKKIEVTLPKQKKSGILDSINNFLEKL